MKVDLAPSDLADAARTQVRHLLQACERFDAGDESEHLSIAVRLRVLLHHTDGPSKAVLEHFGALDQPWFVASGSDVMDEDVLAKVCLAQHGRFGAQGWTPRFDQFGALPKLSWQTQVRYLTRNRCVPRVGGGGREFKDWWNQTVIRDANRVEFSRADIISKVANQDGGAHVDRRIDKSHYDLTRLNTLQIFVGHDKASKASPVPATVRQIGWEIHAMLAAHLPDLVPEGFDPPHR